MALLLALFDRLAVHGQTGAPIGEWRTYGGDLASTRYSPLDQINAKNFNQLEVAWRFKTDTLGPRPEFNFQSTPLMVNGVLYVTAGTRRAVVALDAATGEMLWMHSLNEGKRGEAAPRQLSGRGLAYWTDGKEERIVYVTPGYQMVALDAKTGDRVAGLRQERHRRSEAGERSGDRSGHRRDRPARRPGHRQGRHHHRRRAHRRVGAREHDKAARATSAASTCAPASGCGSSTPFRGRASSATTPGEDDSWSYTGNTGVWAQMTVDEELDIVYLPVEMPTGDYYGGHRPGNTLFGESLVALDLKTGKRKWHYQFVHHGIWDWDIPCAPILADITVNGKVIKAVAQPTKQGWVYVFDRVTGQPVWPIEERPVEKGDVPGERYSPTQPFVTKPPPFERQGVSIDDLIDFTPELRAEAVKLVSRYKLGPIFTPPVVEQVGRTAGDADAAERHRRRQLAGRIARSRDEDPLHLLEHQHQRASVWCQPIRSARR